jgi:acetyl-CoA carboxylase biotin carboxylase subunit
MRRVLIPNRGQIAIRIVRACRDLGLETVVAASEPDRHALAARSADRTVVLGPGPAAESYLRVDAVLQAALNTGCDAIHPGSGFLAQSPELAALAQEQGVVLVGPPTETMALAADRLAVRALARQAGVPVAPVGEPPFGDQTQEQSRPARRIEVQIAADGRGSVVHLGELDCTVQRLGHPLIAETPAPAVAQATPERLRQAAITVAEAIGYANLGTVEFALDPAGEEFFFVEVHGAIRVEHPVTEVVTGRDLVSLQLRIAEGHDLGFTQDEVTAAGHAIECRLNAEDVADQFKLSPGTLSLFSLPERPGLRVDTDCYAGAMVSPYYDSLLAWIVAHGEDRAQAIALMLDALQDVDVDGVETNRTLLTAVLGHPDFADATVTTDWLERAIL